MTTLTTANRPVEKPVWLVSANELLTGNVVYHDRTGSWCSELLNSRVFSRELEAKAVTQLLTQQDSRAIGPTLVAATQHPDGSLSLLHFRDRFRQQGPTHRDDLHQGGALNTATQIGGA